MADVTIAPELARRVRLGVLSLDGVEVKSGDPALAQALDACGAELRARYGALPSAEVPGVADARALYRSLGLDPTKTRPSNEALLRRVLKGEALYQVNTLVDALNLCSLRHQLPFGLYDVDQVVPPVSLRLGIPGESYEGIRKGPINVAGRPTLADARGPFGNPSSDSARTMVRLETRRALVVVFAPASYSVTRLTAVLQDSRDLFIRYCGGRAVEQLLLP